MIWSWLLLRLASPRKKEHKFSRPSLFCLLEASLLAKLSCCSFRGKKWDINVSPHQGGTRSRSTIHSWDRSCPSVTCHTTTYVGWKKSDLGFGKKPHLICYNVVGRQTYLKMALLYFHSSEIGGFCLMKCPSKILQNLPYFYHKKTHRFFHFMLLYFFP